MILRYPRWEALDGAAGLELGDVFRNCPYCPGMVVFPEGQFMMGSPPDEEGHDKDEGPQYLV